MRKVPSAWSILAGDNACWGLLTSVPMVLFVGLAIKLTGTVPGRRGGPDRPVDPEVASMLLACAVAVVLFLSAIVALRVARIRSLFDRGREVEARVRKVMSFRGSRQKLDLEFELYGIPHETSVSFLRWPKTPAFSEGTRIPLLVDPEDPKRAIPLALYGDPGAAQGGVPR
jgi:hypothetical protein